MSDIVFIYGMFVGERCVYVGRTVNPQLRAAAHRITFRTLPVQPVLKVFRKVDATEASRIEGKTIRRYRARGQAEYNIRFTQAPSTKRRVSFKMPAAWLKKINALTDSVSDWMVEAATEKLARENGGSR